MALRSGAADEAAAVLVTRVIDWFETHQRDFPWRDPDCGAWGVLVSEIMSQQTQMSRVEPKWREFMALWPTPADMAKAPVAEVIRRWDRLGYPRRAVSLHACATAIVARHSGEVPASREALLALPGVGNYTSAAVASFAFNLREPVVDTNIRRVLARTRHGDELAWRPSARRDEDEMLAVLPLDPTRAALWNAGSMELGAVVCQARRPLCEQCPVRDLCAWRAAGYPKSAAPARKQPKFAGSDRQLRGQIMALLRQRAEGVAIAEVPDLLRPSEASRVDVQHSLRVLQLAESLVSDGLAEKSAERLHLPR